jgi:hypothetical protein
VNFEGAGGADAADSRTPGRPLENSYVVPGTRLIAGEYPGVHPSSGAAAMDDKLRRFVGARVNAFVDLTHVADEMDGYIDRLRALTDDVGRDVHHDHLPIVDMDTCTPDHMNRVLDVIDDHLRSGRTVYVHCWGGVGRTGMVVGCWLVRHGHEGTTALDQVAQLFATMTPAKLRRHPDGSPQTMKQRAVVRGWAEHDSGPGNPP